VKHRACVIALTLLAAAGSAQSQSAPAAAKPAIPRTADGRPDLSGVWFTGALVLLPDGLPPPPAGPKPAGPKPGAVKPVAEAAPYQPWAVEKIKTFTAKDDPIANCFLPGVPRITAMPMPMQIVQTPGLIVIVYEAFHAFRIIPTDGRGHPEDPGNTFMGDSVGRWEGDTLVVDVVGFNDKTWLPGRGGSFHSDQLHVVERYRHNGETIAYEALLEDPKVFTKPWTYNTTLKRSRPGDRVMEYECLENNVDIPHLVGR
jgi:hypothetical protein